MIQVLPAACTKSSAVRTAERLYRQGKQKFFPKQGFRIDLGRAVFQPYDFFIRRIIGKQVLILVSRGIINGEWFKIFKRAVDRHAGVFGAPIAWKRDFSSQPAADNTAADLSVKLGNKEDFPPERRKNTAAYAEFVHGRRPDGLFIDDERTAFRRQICDADPHEETSERF